MVNSVVATVHGLATSGNLSISLLAPNNSQAPAYPSGNWNLNGLPVLNIRSLWDVTTTFASTSYDLSFRYDDSTPLATGTTVSLLEYSGGAWSLVPNTTLNTSTDLIAATGLQSGAYFAAVTSATTSLFNVTSGDWGNPSSWSPGALPTSVALFNLSNNPTVTLSSSQSVPGVGLWGTGTLTVNDNGGSLTIANPLTVTAGQTLTGTGTINAPITMTGGTLAGTLTVGSVTSVGATFNPGSQLTINGALTLDHNSVLDYGSTSDFIAVSGALTALGTLNISSVPGVGTYPLMSYGSLVGNSQGITLGSTPSGYRYSLTTVSDDLDLVVSALTTAYTFNVTSGDWGSTSSWTPSTGTPTSIDTATFDLASATPTTVTVSSAQSVQGVTLSGTGKLAVNNGLTSGSLTIGTGLTVLTGQTLTGNASITAPTFTLNGTLSGSLHLTGAVNSVGGTITPGGSTTLTITGSLSQDGNSAMDFQLAAPTASNDNISITGTASLDGTLNVTALTGFGVGTYTLVNCSGQLMDNGLKLQAAMPTPVTPSGDSYAGRHNYTYTYSLSSASGQEKLTVALAGDVLGTGVLGAADIDAIYQHLTVLPPGLTSWSQWTWGQAAYNPVYDVNHDGVVSQDDVTYELKHAFNTSYADANLDTYTDYGDFQVLLDHWQLHGGWCRATSTATGSWTTAISRSCWITGTPRAGTPAPARFRSRLP